MNWKGIGKVRSRQWTFEYDVDGYMGPWGTVLEPRPPPQGEMPSLTSSICRKRAC